MTRSEREQLQLIRNAIGDLRGGFAWSVTPANWVRQMQGNIDELLGSGTQPASAELVGDRAGALAPSTSSDSASVSQSLEASRKLKASLLDTFLGCGLYTHTAEALVAKQESLIDAVSAPLKARIAELEAKVNGAALTEVVTERAIVPAPELPHDEEYAAVGDCSCSACRIGRRNGL